jgi:hypothetical protein
LTRDGGLQARPPQNSIITIDTDDLATPQHTAWWGEKTQPKRERNKQQQTRREAVMTGVERMRPFIRGSRLWDTRVICEEANLL